MTKHHNTDYQTERKTCVECGIRKVPAKYARCAGCRDQAWTFKGDRLCVNCGAVPLKRTQKAYCSKTCMFAWRASVKLENGKSPWPASLARKRAYSRWRSMLARCYNPRNKHYHRYGGRGIYVCDRWLTFGNYYGDLGEPPKGMTLDRINNDGPYVPENTRWATAKQQRANVEYEHNKEKTHCPQGHPYSGDNLYVCPKGRRSCRQCSRDKHRRYREERRGATVAAEVTP